jgi:hypothetical protein
MISSIISIVCRLFEIVECFPSHAFIKLHHVVMSFAFSAHLLAVPLMGLLVGIIGIISWIACA